MGILVQEMWKVWPAGLREVSKASRLRKLYSYIHPVVVGVGCRLLLVVGCRLPVGTCCAHKTVATAINGCHFTLRYIVFLGLTL